MRQTRLFGFDCLKILATFFVLFLHMDSYVMSQFGKDLYPITTLVLYYLMEAIAYPAIHLFVMASSWFMIEKVNPVKQIIKVWLQTWVVTMAGLVGAIIIFKGSQESIWGILSCIFPFFGRAYWFVTEYIMLVMLSPFINSLIDSISHKELLCLTMIFGSAVCICPTFLPFFPWNQDTSQIANFILLYLLVGCIKKHDTQKIKKILWVVLWMLCVVILTGSAMIFHDILPSYEMYFYSYNSVFVMLEAICIVMIFKDINYINVAIRDLASWVSGSSLVVYLIHMHPLFKSRYTGWGLFKFVNISSPVEYFFQVCSIVFGVFIIGTIAGKIIDIIVKLLSKAATEVYKRVVSLKLNKK